MKQYVIYRATNEIKDLSSSANGELLSKCLHEGAVFDNEDDYPNTEVIDVYTDKEKALAELQKEKGQALFYRGNAFPYVDIEEYYVEEQEYDEENDYIDTSDILAFAPNNFHKDIIKSAIKEAFTEPEYYLYFPVMINISTLNNPNYKQVYAVVHNQYDYDNEKDNVIVFATDKTKLLALLSEAYPELPIAEQHISYEEDFELWKFEDDIKEYLISKNIAEKIYSNQSAYQMAAYKGHIYISAYDTFNNKEEFIKAIKECELPNGEFDNRYDMTIYDDYKELIVDEYQQVLEDIQDVGLTENGQWNFYLTRDELEQMDISADYIDKQLQLEGEMDYEY